MAARSGDRLFDRRATITITTQPLNLGFVFGLGPTEISKTTEISGGNLSATSGLRIQFDITKSLGKEPNTCRLTVSNLSPTNRAELQTIKGARLQLEAGYAESVATIFHGDVRKVENKRVGADWEAVIDLGDGERAWQWARLNESFAGKTTVQDIVRRLVRAMGIGPGNSEIQLSVVNKRYDHGFALFGSASRLMDKVMNSIRFDWSVQDGELMIHPHDRHPNRDRGIPDITPQSGLLGSPEFGTSHKKNGPAIITIKTLLLPVTPGDRVSLKSERYKGALSVVAVKHNGDTHGGSWETEITAELPKDGSPRQADAARRIFTGSTG